MMSMVLKLKVIEQMEEMIARLILSWFNLECRSKKFQVFPDTGTCHCLLVGCEVLPVSEDK
jgi:hypothetical protein